MFQLAFQKDQSGSIMETGLDKVSLEGENNAPAVVQAGENSDLGQQKEKSGKIGEKFQKCRKGVGVE